MFCRRCFEFRNAQGQTSWDTALNQETCLPHSTRQIYSFEVVLRKLSLGFANVFKGFAPATSYTQTFSRVLTQDPSQKHKFGKIPHFLCLYWEAQSPKQWRSFKPMVFRRNKNASWKIPSKHTYDSCDDYQDVDDSEQNVKYKIERWTGPGSVEDAESNTETDCTIFESVKTPGASWWVGRVATFQFCSHLMLLTYPGLWIFRSLPIMLIHVRGAPGNFKSIASPP